MRSEMFIIRYDALINVFRFYKTFFPFVFTLKPLANLRDFLELEYF